MKTLNKLQSIFNKKNKDELNNNQTSDDTINLEKKRPTPMVLEPRVLFDAAAPAVIADAISASSDNQNSSDNSDNNDNVSVASNNVDTQSANSNNTADANETANVLLGMSRNANLVENTTPVNPTDPTPEEEVEINDAPTITDEYKGTDVRNFSENTSFKLSDIKIEDKQENEVLTVTVKYTAGTGDGGATDKFAGAGSIDGSALGLTYELSDDKQTITFTGSQEQVNKALANLSFKSGENFNGNVTVNITVEDDGELSVSKDINCYIVPVNSNPIVDNDNHIALEVQEGQQNVQFSKDQFMIYDPDLVTGQQEAQQLIIQITSLPAHGQLQFNGLAVAQGSVFSLADVEKLTYSHDSSDVSVGDTTTFTFTVSDGAGGSAEGHVDISLLPKNLAPSIGVAEKVTENVYEMAADGKNLSAYEGQHNAPIGESILVEDQETSHADAMENQTITVSNLQLKAGDFLWFDVDGDGRYTEGTDNVVTNGYEFKASEKNKLYYYNNGDEPTAATDPKFTLTVTDNGGGQGEEYKLSASHDFVINVTEVDDDPVLKNHEVTAGNNILTDITNSNLLVTDIDTEKHNLCYTVVGLPQYGHLLKKPSDQDLIEAGVLIELKVGDTFTQQDIDNGIIQFFYSGSVPEEDTVDHVYFTLKDSEKKVWQDEDDNTGKWGAIYNDNTSELLKFSLDITLDPKTLGGDGPSYGTLGENNFKVLHNSTINVYEGQSTLISSDLLEYELSKNFTLNDGTGKTIYTPANQLYFHLDEEIENGYIEVKRGDAWVRIVKFEGFTQQDINDGNVRFHHDGKEDMLSEIKLTVNDGSVYKEITVKTDAIPINDRPEITTDSIQLNETVSQDDDSGYAFINANAIHLSDLDIDNDKKDSFAEGQKDYLYIHFSGLPANGTLEYYDGSSWVEISNDNNDGLWLSQNLLESNYIRYHHNGNDDVASLKDSIKIVCRDDLAFSTNVLTDQLPPSNGELQTPDGKPYYNLGDDGLYHTEDADGTLRPEYVTGNNLSNEATLNIIIAPMNDSPVIGNSGESLTSGILVSINKEIHIGEGENAKISADYLKAVDSDNNEVQRQFKIVTATQYGELILNGKPLAVGSTFTQADINNGALSYRHNGSDASSNDEFTFVVSDGVNTTEVKNFVILIDPDLNDVAELVVPEKPLVHDKPEFSFKDLISITDADLLDGHKDSNEDFMRVTLSASIDNVATDKVIYVTSGINGVDIVKNEGGEIILQGELAKVNAALNALKFTTNGEDLNAEITFKVVADDRLRNDDGTVKTETVGDKTVEVANGGHYNMVGHDSDTQGNAKRNDVGETNNLVEKSFTVFSSIKNDAPTFDATTGDLADSMSVTEDKWSSIAQDKIEVKDLDAFNSNTNVVTVTVTDGKVRFGDSGDGAASITFTGTLDEINQKLNSLQYLSSENANTPDATQANGAPKLTVTFNDKGNFGDGINPDITYEKYIEIKPVNDKPTLEINGLSEDIKVNGHPSIILDTLFTFSSANGTAIVINDPKDIDNTAAHFDAPNKFTVTISATVGTEPYGTFVVGSSTDVIVTSTNGGSTYELTGTKEAVNALLDGLQYKAPQDNYNVDKQVDIKVVVDDYGNGNETPTTEKGVEGNTETKHVYFVLSSENDAPTTNVSTVPDIHVKEDSETKIFADTAHKITFSDQDVYDSNTNYVIITINNSQNINGIGSLSCEKIDGVSKVELSNDGTQIKITGTIDGINNAMQQVQYKPAENVNYKDPVTINVEYHDNGNWAATVNGAASEDKVVKIENINLYVDAVNDAPVVKQDNAVASMTTNVSEDATGNAIPSQTVGSLVGSFFSDATDDRASNHGSETNTLAGVVIVGNTATSAQGTWQYKDGNTWKDIPTSASESAGLYLSADLEIRFAPKADFNGEPGKLTVHLVETGSTTYTSGANVNLTVTGATGGESQVSVDTVVIQTSVDAVNDAPTGATAIVVPSIDSNTKNDTGVTIDSFLKDKFDDAKDNVTNGSSSDSFDGIVIIGNSATAEQGKWQYKDGTTWKDIPADASDSTGFFISHATEIRFEPATDFNGTPGQLTYVIAETINNVNNTNGSIIDVSNRDETSHYSQTSSTISTSVTLVNHPVELGGITTDANGVATDVKIELNEDASFNLSSVLGALTITDKDSEYDSKYNSFTVKLESSHGSFVNAAGETVTEFTGTKEEIKNFLNNTKYVPVENFNGTDSVKVTVSDQGVETTAVNSASVSIGVTVKPVNDAPTGVKPITMPEMNGNTVDSNGYFFKDVLNSSFEDTKDAVTNGSSSNDFDGIVIIGNSANATTEGKWEYKVGDEWKTIPSSANATNGFFISKDCPIRFTPVTDYSGTPGGLTYVLAETGTITHTNGATVNVSHRDATSQYSVESSSVSIDVKAVNHPVVVELKNNTTVTLTEDSDKKLSEILGNNWLQITDIDIDASATYDKFTVSLSSPNASFTDGTEAVTSFTGTRAEIYDFLNSVVYVPHTDFNGNDTITVTVQDYGVSSFNVPSKASVTVNVNVDAENDAPSVSGSVTLPDIEKGEVSDGYTVGQLLAGHYSDAKDNIAGGSNADALDGIVIVGNNVNASQGAWQYNSAGTWVNVPSDVSVTNGLYLSSDSQIRFEPTADFTGTPDSLSYKVTENGYVATSGSLVDVSVNDPKGHYSLGTSHLTINIKPPFMGNNIAPVDPSVAIGSTPHGGVGYIQPEISNPRFDGHSDLLDLNLGEDDAKKDFSFDLDVIQIQDWTTDSYFEIDLDSQYMKPGLPTVYTIPESSIYHSDNVDVGKITFAATLENGDPLPSWIVFNEKDRQFTVTLPDGVDRVDVRVVGTDENGKQAEATFEIIAKLADPELKNSAKSSLAHNENDETENTEDDENSSENSQSSDSKNLTAQLKQATPLMGILDALSLAEGNNE